MAKYVMTMEFIGQHDKEFEAESDEEAIRIVQELREKREWNQEQCLGEGDGCREEQVGECVPILTRNEERVIWEI